MTFSPHRSQFYESDLAHRSHVSPGQFSCRTCVLPVLFGRTWFHSQWFYHICSLQMKIVINIWRKLILNGKWNLTQDLQDAPYSQNRLAPIPPMSFDLHFTPSYLLYKVPTEMSGALQNAARQTYWKNAKLAMTRSRISLLSLIL